MSNPKPFLYGFISTLSCAESIHFLLCLFAYMNDNSPRIIDVTHATWSHMKTINQATSRDPHPLNFDGIGSDDLY